LARGSTMTRRRFQKRTSRIRWVAALAASVALAPVVVVVACRGKPNASAGAAAPAPAAPARPSSESAASVPAQDSSAASGSRPAMPADCIDLLSALSDKIEAWARTTTDTDAIGDKASCLEAKRLTQAAARHCRIVGSGEPAVHPDWCESPSYVHPRVLLLRRERARKKVS